MAELGWREAIIKVLHDAGRPMNRTEIAQEVAARGLRSKLGATPAHTVVSAITSSMQNDENSPFIRVSRRTDALRDCRKPATDSRAQEIEDDDEAGFINAFGMYWKRASVLWTSSPRLLGQQQLGSKPVNFCDEIGVYLLHDVSRVVYVGRTTDQPLGVRLRQHTVDRLNGRWDRFSWFGIYGVTDDGLLSKNASKDFSMDNLIATMEALLIEGLEPPQNRKRGDDFSAIEFQQIEDPEIQKNQRAQFLDELKDRLLNRPSNI